jgi:hypothetical protein
VAPAPAQAPGRPALLTAAVDGAPVPNWEYAFKWNATGQRVDDLHGRRIRTVFYERGGRRVGYQIVPGARVPPPVAVETRIVKGRALRSFQAGGRTIVTWLRQGRTCVLSGRGVPVGVLYRLAAWTAKGQVPF